MIPLIPLLLALAADPAPAATASAPAQAVTPPAATATAAPATPVGKDVPIPPKVPATGQDPVVPTVTIRAGVKGDRIEEYRLGGRLTMIRVTPAHGKPYYLYDDNGDGRLDRSDIDRAGVRPVYWEIASW